MGRPGAGFWLVLAVYSQHAIGLEAAETRDDGLSEFFRSVDVDGDGQIEPAEALRYIGDSFGAELPEQERTLAVQQMSQNLDGSDTGVTISKAEVAEHLHSLLKGNRVAEWVKHAVGLPQYVDTFRQNSVTSLDFPTMVSDSGSTLENDLKVTSRLHRQQITRAIKRLMLGLGQAPSAPQGLVCQPVTCSTVRLGWAPPERLGHPPMHKYKLERQLQLGTGAAFAPALHALQERWVTSNGELDDEDLQWQDAGLQAGQYRYRLAAWNAYGWSPYATVADCAIDSTSLPCEACERSGSCQATAAGLGTVNGMKGQPRAASQPQSAWVLGMWTSAASAAVAAIMVLVLPRPRKHAFREARRAVSRLAPHHVRRTSDTMLEPKPISRRGSTMPDITSAERAFLLGMPNGAALATGTRDDDEINEGASDPVLQAGGRTPDGHGPHRRSSLECSPSEAKSWRRSDHPEEMDMHAPARSLGEVPSAMRMANTSQRLRASSYLAHGDGYPLQPGHQSMSMGNEDAKVQMWLRGSTSTRAPLQLEGTEEGSDADDDRGDDEDLPPTPHHVDRNRCAHSGCHRKFHRLRLTDVKHALTRHYCSVCQNVYCHHHTHYSPHGNYGSCGMESKCICKTCFFQLPRVTQDRLHKTNKLVKASSSSSLADKDKDKSKSAAASRASSTTRTRGSSFIAASAPGPAPLPASSRFPAAAAPHSTHAQAAGAMSRVQERTASSTHSASSLPASRSMAQSASLASRVTTRDARSNWALARTAFDAAYRFQHAGEVHRQRRGQSA